MLERTSGAKRASVRALPERKQQRSEIKQRIVTTMETAASLGLTQGKKERRLSLRANERLIRAAQATSGLEGSDLLEYALAKVALEDDYVEKLLALRGSIDPDLDLEF